MGLRLPKPCVSVLALESTVLAVRVGRMAYRYMLRTVRQIYAARCTADICCALYGRYMLRTVRQIYAAHCTEDICCALYGRYMLRTVRQIYAAHYTTEELGFIIWQYSQCFDGQNISSLKFSGL
jgi:hypothetical protein